MQLRATSQPALAPTFGMALKKDTKDVLAQLEGLRKSDMPPADAADMFLMSQSVQRERIEELVTQEIDKAKAYLEERLKEICRYTGNVYFPLQEWLEGQKDANNPWHYEQSYLEATRRDVRQAKRSGMFQDQPFRMELLDVISLIELGEQIDKYTGKQSYQFRHVSLPQAGLDPALTKDVSDVWYEQVHYPIGSLIEAILQGYCDAGMTGDDAESLLLHFKDKRNIYIPSTVERQLLLTVVAELPEETRNALLEGNHDLKKDWDKAKKAR